jgi:hypothetical protein
MRSFKSDTKRTKKVHVMGSRVFVNIAKRTKDNNFNRRSTVNTSSKILEDSKVPATYCTKCLVAISHSVNIIKAFIMRLLFSMHSFIAICIVYAINQELWCLVNVVGVVFLLIELFVTIIRRKGKEPKWLEKKFHQTVCPWVSFFCQGFHCLFNNI